MLFTDMKSDNNEEKCNQFKTFSEEDIKDLDDLIAKKYMNMKSFKKGMFMYQFAVGNVDEIISLPKRFDAAILAFKNKVINELKDYPEVQSCILTEMEEVIKNVEDSTANIRESERTLQAKIKNLRENLVEKRETIEQYMSCKSKQRRAESIHGFLKEIEESWAFTMLTTYGNFPNLKNNLKEQLKISENMKSDNNEEKCNQFKTFSEEDIKDLDDLIAKKYMNTKSFKKGMFMYDFAVRNVDEIISLGKEIGAFLQF